MTPAITRFICLCFIGWLSLASAQHAMHYDQQPLLGSGDAPVTLAIFEDFQCGHCKHFNDSVLTRLESRFVDNGEVKVYFYNYPFLGEASTQAALAGECVHSYSPDVFWDVKEAIFAEYNQLAKYTIEDFIKLLNGYVPQQHQVSVAECLASEESHTALSQDITLGRALAIRGTPAIFVNGDHVASPSYRQVTRVINQALKER